MNSSIILQIKEPKNNCPECLYMKIRGELVKKRLLAQLISQKAKFAAINLFLQIGFNEQWIDFSFGRVKLGLRRGELRLTLEKGKIPYELRFLQKELETKISTERQFQKEKKQQAEGVFSLAKEGSFKAVAEDSEKGTYLDEFPILFTINQISNKGTEECPVWVFENKTGERVLIGQLFDVPLAQMKVDGASCKIEAKFTVAIGDIQITGCENIFGEHIDFDKAWQLSVAKLWLKHNVIGTYLSRQVLSYG